MSQPEHMTRVSPFPPACSAESSERAAIKVRLQRGGGQWLAYDQCSDELRKEWDASEAIVNALRAGRELYMWGCFPTVPSDVKSFLSEEGKLGTVTYFFIGAEARGGLYSLPSPGGGPEK